MAIPDGKLYSDGTLSAGTVATIEDSIVNTESAGADINFGAGVVLQNGKVVPATKAPIYGVALKRTYINGDHFYDATIDGDHWEAGENLGVLRLGTISVPISDDVDRGENATVDAQGNFKPAGASDTVVGVFLSDGNKGGTASMQTSIQLASGTSSASSTSSNTSTGSTGTSSTGSTGTTRISSNTRNSTSKNSSSK